MKIPRQCPMCGSTSWECISTSREGFSFRNSVLAGLFFGRRIGLWFGLRGKRKKTYICRSCGFSHEFEG